MKRSRLVLFPLVLAVVALTAHAQVVPSSRAQEPRIAAGAFGSMFQPDYAGNGIAQASPNRLYGPGAYVDVRLKRWLGVEGEARWLHYNEYLGINEDSYSIGPKIPIIRVKKFTPYGKFLVGIGSGSFLSGHTTMLTYGGGVDYDLSKRFSVRAFDFEYQQWMVTPTLWPYGGSIGIAYKIF